MNHVTEISSQPTWTDPATGLCWSLDAPRLRISRPAAVSRLNALNRSASAGDPIWRLPTMDEVASLGDEAASTLLSDARRTLGVWVDDPAPVLGGFYFYSPADDAVGISVGSQEFFALFVCAGRAMG